MDWHEPDVVLRREAQKRIPVVRGRERAVRRRRERMALRLLELHERWGVVRRDVDRTAAVTADEVAAMNRLTVNVSLKFTNRKYPEEDFEKSFSAYSDYDSTNSLDAVEASLCEEIVEKLAEDMFNASVAQW